MEINDKEKTVLALCTSVVVGVFASLEIFKIVKEEIKTKKQS